MFKSTYEGKKVLITGNTGFKGSWLTIWLLKLGAKVYGLSKDIPTKPSMFDALNIQSLITYDEKDVRDLTSTIKLIDMIKPDFIFHLAAQSLVLESYLEPIETITTNVIGTANILEALRQSNHKCVGIIITSDKCYDNVEWTWGYRESDAIGGNDPYSASKGAAELLIRAHVKSFFPKDGAVRIAVGRAGNVIGGGDWASDRIVPDCVRSWAKGEKVKLRNPHSTRPWQHVLEPLSGYLTLAAELDQREELHGEPFNFGPPAHQNHTVLELVYAMSRHWDQVLWEDISTYEEHPYESELLKLNCDKALHYLCWQASLSFQETVRMTAEWYRSYYENPSTIRQVTLDQIKEYKTVSSH